MITAFGDGVTISEVRSTMGRMRPRKYLMVEEQCVLKVLRTR